MEKDQISEILAQLVGTMPTGTAGTSAGFLGALKGLGDITPKDKGFMDSFFGDKGALSGITNAVTGLGGLALSFSTLSNAKKQQKFSNRAMTTQTNNAYKVYDDGINQRSQSQAASLGLQGQDRQGYVDKEKERTKLDRI